MIFAANWKMHKTQGEAAAFFDAFLKKSLPQDDRFIFFPPFTALQEVVKLLQKTPIFVGAQNVYFEREGAFTGEVSVAMVRELGVRFCLVGHSERRHIFGELNAWMGKKVAAVLEGGLVPIYCVGETKEERAQGATERVLAEQLEAALSPLRTFSADSFVIAYEPVWAIGTGSACPPKEAGRQAAWIKEWFQARGVATPIEVLYGGSVSPTNAAAFLKEPGISGLLVGGASLDPEKFYAVIASQ